MPKFNSIDEITVSFKKEVLSKVFENNFAFVLAFAKTIVRNKVPILDNKELTLSNGQLVLTWQDVQNWNNDLLVLAKKEKYSKKEIQKWLLSDYQLSFIKKLFDQTQFLIDNFIPPNQANSNQNNPQVVQQDPNSKTNANQSEKTFSPLIDSLTQPQTKDQSSTQTVEQNNIKTQIQQPDSNNTNKTLAQNISQHVDQPIKQQVNQKPEFSKVLIVSDDHVANPEEKAQLVAEFGFDCCNKQTLLDIIQKVQPEYIFHQGDICSQELFEQLKNKYQDNFFFVKGNNDTWIEYYNQKVNTINIQKIRLDDIEYSFFQLHGDGFVSPDWLDEDVWTLAISKLIKQYPNELTPNPDFILFGHSHRPNIEKKQNSITINPGSVNLNYFLKKKPSIGSFFVLYLSNKDKKNTYLEKYEILLKDDKSKEIKLTETVKIW